MTASTPVRLPSVDEIELAEHKLGHFTSDLEAIKTALEQANRAGSVEEYLAAKERGEEYDPLRDVDLDADRLARLLVFAADLLGDVEGIRQDAESILGDLRALYHQRLKVSDSGRDLIAEWHIETAERYGGRA